MDTLALRIKAPGSSLLLDLVLLDSYSSTLFGMLTQQSTAYTAVAHLRVLQSRINFFVMTNTFSFHGQNIAWKAALKLVWHLPTLRFWQRVLNLFSSWGAGSQSALRLQFSLVVRLYNMLTRHNTLPQLGMFVDTPPLPFSVRRLHQVG